MFIMLNINFLSLWMKSVNIHARGEKGASPFQVSSTPRLKNRESNACSAGYVLTDYTAIKFHTHGDPAIPREWVYPEKASCDAFFQPVPHDYELIVIALEYLNVKERVNQKFCTIVFSFAS